MNQRALLITTIVLAVLAASIGLLAYNQSSQIATLEEKRSTLETENADLSQKKAALASEKANLLANVSTLQEQLLQATNQANSLKQNISRLESDNTFLKSSLTSRESTITSLRKDLADAEGKITQLNKQISNYLAQIASMNAPIDQRHLNATLLAQQNCSQCHSQVRELALKNQSNNYHNLHFNNQLLNFTCTDCHRSVDIKSNTTDVAKIVDVPTCKQCHTTFPVKVWMGRTSTPDQFAMQFSDCTRCHDNWKELKVDAKYVNLDKVTESDCATCHLKKALFSTERMPVDIGCNKCH